MIIGIIKITTFFRLNSFLQINFWAIDFNGKMQFNGQVRCVHSGGHHLHEYRGPYSTQQFCDKACLLYLSLPQHYKRQQSHQFWGESPACRYAMRTVSHLRAGMQCVKWVTCVQVCNAYSESPACRYAMRKVSHLRAGMQCVKWVTCVQVCNAYSEIMR